MGCMDYYLTLMIVFIITAIALAVSIYVIMIRIFRTERIQPFVFALLMLIICEIMVIFLAVLSAFKVTGIA